MLLRGLIRGLLRGLARGLTASVGGRAIVAPTLLAENSSSTDGTSFPFAESASPPGGRLLLMAVASAHATAAEVPNSVSAYGLTWTQVTNSSVLFNANTKRVVWFYAWGAAPTTGTVTLGFATTHTAVCYAVFSIYGARLKAPRQATTASAGAALTITGTLAALENPTNLHVYALMRNVNEVSAPPATGSWLELSDRLGGAAPSCALEVAWTRSGDLTADPTWVSSSQSAISNLECEAA
jgi:hypothetical protein